MKKYRQFTLALLLVILFPALAMAASDENVTKRRPDRGVQAEIQEIRQSDVSETKIRMIAAHADRLEKRFSFYYDRLNKIIIRFEERLSILTKAGKNIKTIQIKLNTAKAKLLEAKLKGESVVSLFRTVDPTKLREQKVVVQGARDMTVATIKLFQESHNLLKSALKELKTISKPALPAASAAVQNSE